MGAQRFVQLAGGRIVGFGNQCRGLVSPHQPNPAVARAQGLGPYPHDLACREQRVEIGRGVIGDPSRKDRRFEHRRRQRRPLKRGENLGETVDPPMARPDVLPVRHEAGEHILLNRLDLGPQRGQRSPTQHSEHVRVTPLAFHTVWPELAAHHSALAFEFFERAPDPVGFDPQR